MDTSTDIEAIIRETAKLAALESARAVLKEQAQKAAGRADRRLHNTKLLLKNYRMFKKHCTGAVYTMNQVNMTEARKKLRWNCWI